MNTITIDGKEYNLSDELVEKIKEEIKAQDKPAFERNNRYYFIGSDGIVSSHIDCDNRMIDGARYAIANYCTNEDLIQQRAWHEILNRQLWRYAEERNKNLPWDGIQLHYAICYDYQDHDFAIDDFYISKYNGMIYFDYKKDAALAIEEIIKPFMGKHPQFVW